MTFPFGGEPAPAGAAPEKKPLVEGAVLDDIIFSRKPRTDFPGTFDWYNSVADRSRKRIELMAGSALPKDDRTPYKVKIVKDTKPGDPNAGKLMVEIVFDTTLPPAAVEPPKAKKENVPVAKPKEHEIVPDPARNQVFFGKEATPIFEPVEKELLWRLEAEQHRESGKTVAELVFRRSDGLEVRPGEETAGKRRFPTKDRYMPFERYRELAAEYYDYGRACENLNSSDDEVAALARKYMDEAEAKFKEDFWVLRALRHLNSKVTKEKFDVLSVDKRFVETQHVADTLEKFARMVNRQREARQGVVIIEGDAGTGKNVMVDHFAALTGRPRFRFTCSAGKDEQDIKYLLEFDAKKGTYRIKSEVIKALETPGAILIFDEINTMKPEVAKILNSLFDSDRTLYTGESGGGIKAAKDVVMVGLQNPQHYDGVEKLADTIVSRAKIMEVTYPPFLEGGKYRSDEALIVRKAHPALRKLTQEQFVVAWNKEANNVPLPEKFKDLITGDMHTAFEDIKQILIIANAIRLAYRNYRTGASDTEINFIFSQRETIESVRELGYVKLGPGEKRSRKAVEDVILPKIPLGAERNGIKALINQA